MSDQCKHCTLRGRLAACLISDCGKHQEDWFGVQLKEMLRDATIRVGSLEANRDALIQWYEGLPDDAVIYDAERFDEVLGEARRGAAR